MQTLNIFFSNKNSHKYFNLVFLVGFFFLLNNFGFNEQDLQDEIERMNNQYSMPKGPIANVKRQPPKRRVSSSNVIGYMRHSKLNNNN